MPPLPEPYSAATALGLDNLHTADVVHAYAKAYAAPLIARVAELQAERSALTQGADGFYGLLNDDSYAMSFQTMGQYRTALLKAIDAAIAAKD